MPICEQRMETHYYFPDYIMESMFILIIATNFNSLKPSWTIHNQKHPISGMNWK